MEFYITNKELDGQISEIKRKIRLSMNGVVSDQMKNSGVTYKQNYGVAIPRLKEIAKGYSANHDLAQRLWLLKIRESMILSTLLEPVDKFTINMALSRVSELSQIEMVEQTCMNLLSKLPYANDLVIQCINSDRLWTRISGFILAARVYNQLNNEQVKVVTDKAFQYADTDEFYLYKSIALCLSRLCRLNASVAEQISAKINCDFGAGTVAQQYIGNEVKHEIDFLDNI